MQLIMVSSGTVANVTPTQHGETPQIKAEEEEEEEEELEPRSIPVGQETDRGTQSQETRPRRSARVALARLPRFEDVTTQRGQ